MTSQPQPVTTLRRSPHHTPRPFGAIAVGLALVLLFVAGVVLLPITREEDRITPAPDAALTAPAPAVTPSDQPRPTYFLVESQTQADLIQRGIDDAAEIRDAQGATPLTASVVQFPTSEAETAFWLDRHEQETIRARLGQNPATVVDLRAPALGPTSTCRLDILSPVC
jgi:hypothetical protein